MNFAEWLEDQVKINERRIARIEANPDPVKLKSNKLFYELERRLRLSQLATIREGRPNIQYPGAGTGDLFRSMGFEFSSASYFNRKSTTDLTMQSREAYSAAGYPEQYCDLAVSQVAWTLTGTFPAMSCAIRSNATCQPYADAATARGLLQGEPILNLTIPMDPYSEEDIAYVVEQLEEFIPWLEKKFPGVHYSDEKLEEWLNAEAEVGRNYHRIWETKKHKPCPESARDSFREEMPAYMYPDKELFVAWSQMWADEMEARVASGKNLPKESVRLAWTNTAPISDHEIFPWLEEQGVTIPAFLWPGCDHTFTIRPSYDLFAVADQRGYRPLQKLAMFLCCCSINGLADRFMSNYVDCAQDQDVDGFVFYANRGCVQQQGAIGLVAQEVQRRLGIPFVVIYGTQVDVRGYNQAESMQRLTEFLELVRASKARRR
ncbi:MAG: 2-hydroxyacyl-CoA dehydratase [Chloroflexi bacterium]|nr:2-hydroxyacyl-CoA dehydratase [Chloroflexota bacterium]